MRLALRWLTRLTLLLLMSATYAAPPQFAAVLPQRALQFPADFGAHPEFRNEWWYVTGWLQTPDNKPIGFQITFFRIATEHDAANPSKFAPKHLLIAHAALSDPAVGKLQHAQKSARAGFDLAYAREGNTDVKLDDWYFTRRSDGSYQAHVATRDFTMDFAIAPTQAPMLQGDAGFSRKGPRPEQASHYYSEPHLRVTGTLTRQGKPLAVTGSAWLDHEWSTSMLDPDAAGWDWVGANLDDGSAWIAFRMRGKNGDTLWSYSALRAADGRMTQFPQDRIRFSALRQWRSPRTEANYPVATRIDTGDTTWEMVPLQDDQELDARLSSGAVYWEGAVTVKRAGKVVGRGYLELTGYVKPLKF